MGNETPEIPQTVLPQELVAAIEHVILVGGSFDPIHAAHVKIPVEARATLPEPEWRASWLVFVPAAVSPFKVEGGADLEADLRRATAPERAAMVKLAIGGVERACIWTDEIDRARDEESRGLAPRPSYTIETVRRALAARPGLRVRIMIGADQAGSLHRWRAAHELVALSRPICVLRPPIETAKDLRELLKASGAWSEDELETLCMGAATAALMPVSSSKIRAAIADGAEAAALCELNPVVARKIDELGLYRRIARR